MRLILLLLATMMFSTTATAHEVKPPPMKEACGAAKWLGNELAGTPLSDPEYNRLDTMASRAFDECERYQENAIDWTGMEREIDAAIERAAKQTDIKLKYQRASDTVTKCD